MGYMFALFGRQTAISVKKRNFFPLRVFYTPADRVTLEIGIGARGQKLEWWGYQIIDKLR